MPLIYRVMKTADDGKPLVGPSGKALGVRVPTDIRPDGNGDVSPGTGGMSVSPSLWALPALLVPFRLRHLVPGAAAHGRSLRVWRMGAGPFAAGRVADGLDLRPDSPTHGTVQPATIAPLRQYEGDLAATRVEWVIDETGA